MSSIWGITTGCVMWVHGLRSWLTPVLREYSPASAKPVVQAIEDARNKHVEADLDQFLANRFGKRMVAPIKAIHETEEGRPIETLWDVTDRSRWRSRRQEQIP